MEKEQIFYACPQCHGEFAHENGGVRCVHCKTFYAVRNDVYYFTNTPTPNIDKPANAPEKWSVWRKLNFAYFAKKLDNLAPGSRILDVGSGPCQFSALFEKYRYTAMDFSPYKGVKVVSDVTKRFPFQADIFDCVVMSNVLEHLHTPQATLKEAFRVMKNGGIAITTVPFIHGVHQAPHDFSRYTHFMLERLFKEAGFARIQINAIGTIFDVQENLNANAFRFCIQNFKRRTANKYKRHLWEKMLRWEYSVAQTVYRHIARVYKGNYRDDGTANFPWGYGVIAQKDKTEKSLTLY